MKHLRSTLLTISSLFFSIVLFAQTNPGEPTNATERMKTREQRVKLSENSILENIEIKNIGPTVFSGRVSAIDINPEDPTEFLVAYASGGLWITRNNGTTFSPIFDHQDVLTIGDIDVDWMTGTIWVGTGEVNSSRSSYAGTGAYVSRDMGKNWEHKGLEESHHIGRILIHPKKKNTIFVAVLGHLYSRNSERGIYKSTDGGNTWKKTLYIDDKTGAIDLILDPKDDKILYAAMWTRERSAWDFIESGIGSGIYKSTNTGNNWELISGNDDGFPSGEGVGRIGLDAAIKNGKTVLYAILDNYNRRPKEDQEEDDEDGLTKDDLRNMDKDSFLKIAEDKIKTFLKSNNFPEKYTAGKVIKMIERDEILPNALVEYLENANSLLFDTPVIGAEVYVYNSKDKNWSKTHEGYINGLYNSYGYYFGVIRVAANNPDKLYIMGVPFLKSDDGGKTWKNINGDNVHVDHHALWVNPDKTGHLINGNDGGINISYDDGENWIKCNSPAVGQFYYVNVDMKSPYNVYGGLQDNGVWFGPSDYEWSSRWHSTGKYPYQSILGGDGMQIQIDSRDGTIYTGFQFGNYFRINGSKRKSITPKHDLGDRPYRWNWQSPILLSKHNQDIVYFGANKLLRSMDRGESFNEISEDLTHGGKKGDVPYGTISTIDESKHQFGLLYVGTDDGKIYRTDDGGYIWHEISSSLPQNLWVSRIIASDFDKDRVYAVLNGYRWDDFNSYLYASENRGETWQKIGKDLPTEPLNVIKEDPVNENILYVGGDHGAYVSIDMGKSFMTIGKLPVVPVHDMIVHPRENELIIATHGRSFYKANVKPLQKLVNDGLTKDELYVFGVNDVRSSSRWGSQSAVYRDPIEPEIDLSIYSADTGNVTVQLIAGEDLILKTKKYKVGKGIQILKWELSIDDKIKEDYLVFLNADKKADEDPLKFKSTDTGKTYVMPGTYTFKITNEKGESSTKLVVK